MGLERGRNGLVEPSAQASALDLCLFCDLGLVVPPGPVSPPEVGPNAVRDPLALFGRSQLFGIRLP